MLKKITKWETEDGKVFDTQEEAEDYMFEQEKEVMTHASTEQPEALTVKLPSESAGWFKWDKISQCWHPQYSEYAETYAKVQGWQKLYTEQQVIGLMKSVDVTVKL